MFVEKTCARREYKRTKNIGMKNVLSFRTKAAKGPVCACVCCQRLLFEDQVQTYRGDVYNRKSTFIGERAKSAISKTFCTLALRNAPMSVQSQNYGSAKLVIINYYEATFHPNLL